MFFNGAKAAGYAHGNLAFEALLTTVTAGYGTLAKAIAVQGLSVFRGLGDDLLEVVKKGVSAFVLKKVDNILLNKLNNLQYGSKNGNFKDFVTNNLNTLITNWTTIWAMPSTVNRGKLIEEILARTYFKDWQNVGQLKGGNLNLGDFYHKNGTLSQLKSVNTTNISAIKTYNNDFSNIIDKLIEVRNSKVFNPANGLSFPVNMVRFDLCLPNNFDENLFEMLILYGMKVGVKVNIIKT